MWHLLERAAHGQQGAIMRLFICFFAAVLASGMAPLAYAQGSRGASDDFYGRKYALVIGNGAYEGSALPNPENDAADMAEALKKAGFKVSLHINADLAAMRLALAEFESTLPEEAAAFVFYAGHGVQYQGQNYLIPIDALNKVHAAADLATSALSLAEITQQLASRRKGISVIVLDACRDSPFSNVQDIEPGLSRSTGLKDLKAPEGTKANKKAARIDGAMVAYSTAPNATASDGTGRNSPYTKHLKEHIRQPNASLETVLKLTRVGVTKDTKGRQTPWYESSINGDFYAAGRGRIEFDVLLDTLINADNAWHPQSNGQDVIVWKDTRPVLNRSNTSEFKDAFGKPILYGFKRRGSVIITRDGVPVHFGENDAKPAPWNVTLIGARAGVDLVSIRSSTRSFTGGDGDIFETSARLREIDQCERKRGAEENRVFRIKDANAWLYMYRFCGASACEVEYFVILSNYGLEQFGCKDTAGR